MFARRRKTGRTWGSGAGDRTWMTVEQMWDRYPERFTDRGVGPDEADTRDLPVLVAH